MRTVLVFTKGTSVEKFTWEILDFRINEKKTQQKALDFGQATNHKGVMLDWVISIEL